MMNQKYYVNLALFALVCVYILFGAVVFRNLESNFKQQQKLVDENYYSVLSQCVLGKLYNINSTNNSNNKEETSFEATAESIIFGCLPTNNGPPVWSFADWLAFSFSVITMLGFGNIGVSSRSGGRSFEISQFF